MKGNKKRKKERRQNEKQRKKKRKDHKQEAKCALSKNKPEYVAVFGKQNLEEILEMEEKLDERFREVKEIEEPVRLSIGGNEQK